MIRAEQPGFAVRGRGVDWQVCAQSPGGSASLMLMEKVIAEVRFLQSGGGEGKVRVISFESQQQELTPQG